MSGRARKSTKAKRTVLTLVPDPVCRETFQVLEQLLVEALQGQIIGMAFVAQYKQRRFIADATGVCRTHPVFTRGMLKSLDDALARQLDADS